MTPARPIATVGAAFLFSFSGLLPLVAQEPAASAAPQASPTPPASAAPSTPAKKKKHSHADDFLIRGTVFTPAGLSFPGAELRVRRPSEKKFRWETQTNSRGEFAVRVPQGADYELIVRAKGFTEQSRALDAKSGREESLVFRMEAVKVGGKK